MHSIGGCSANWFDVCSLLAVVYLVTKVTAVAGINGEPFSKEDISLGHGGILLQKNSDIGEYM